MTVRAFLFITLLGLLAFHSAYAESDTVTLFVQTIVGTNRKEAGDAGKAKEIGPALRKDLSPVFQWKHYREVSCQKVEVRRGKLSRIQLTAERELELRLTNDSQLELGLLRGGKLVRKMKDSSHRRVIMGGDSNKDEAWFVVIRRDKPSTE